MSPLTPSTASNPPPGVARGLPLVLLRLEGLVALGAAVVLYRVLGGGWGLFAALFLAPDLGMAGYAFGPKAGALAYDAVHTYLAPALLAVASWAFGAPSLLPLALVWSAHIGFDRAVGYGLKYPESFHATHLSWRRA